MNVIQQGLQHRFIDRMCASSRGRASFLANMADAESSDEGAIFELLAAKVDDPALQKMIRVHQADEIRHAELFWKEVDRQGHGRPVVPESQKFIARLDRRVGGFVGKKLETDHDVLIAYLILQVIEERAITQFKQIVPLLRPHDPHAAGVIEEVVRDEERHLRYCHAISRRYASSSEDLEHELARLRQLETEAFVEQQRANLEHIVGHGFMEVSRLELAGWRWLARSKVSERAPLPRTPYWGKAPGEALAA